jgi:hypothetical protein
MVPRAVGLNDRNVPDGGSDEAGSRGHGMGRDEFRAGGLRGGGMNFGQVDCGEVRFGCDEFRAAGLQNSGR